MSQEDFVVDFGQEDILEQAGSIGNGIEFMDDPTDYLQNAISTGETDLTTQNETKSNQTQNESNQNEETYNDENELPLLEELGIDFKAIGSKMLHHLNPFSVPDAEEIDIIGSILILMFIAISLLLLGKIHFGIIYGYSIIANTVEYFVMNLLSQKNIDFSLVFTHFSYCLFPNIFYVVVLFILQFFGINKMVMQCIGIVFVGLSTFMCSRIFNVLIDSANRKLLVLYPIMLYYGLFILFVMF